MRNKPGAYERRLRQTEALLLFLTLLILLVGAGMLLAVKGQEVARSGSGIVNINVASAEDFSRTLGVSTEVGKRLVAERERRGNGGFDDVDALARIPLLPKAEAAEAAEALRSAGLASPHNAAGPQVRQTLSKYLPEGTWDRFAARLADARPGDTWERILSGSLVPASRVSAMENQMAVRTWEEARRTFLLCCAGLVFFLALTHVLLRRAHPRADPFLLPITGLLSVMGLLLLFSLKDPIRDMPTFAAQAQGVVVGGALAFLLALSGKFNGLPLHRYGYVYALAAVLGTLVLGVFGSGPGGVKLSVAGTQPVEVIKILLVFFLAAYLAERAALLNDPLRKWGPFPLPRRRDAAPLLVLYALPLVLFAIVRDLGPVLLLFGTFLTLVYLATGRGIYVLLGLLALGIGGYVGYKLGFGVFETRVDMWLSPWKNGHKSGDHLALGLWGLASGGPVGSGLGLGGTRYIPRGGSDLAFAALGEEMGIWGALTVVLCFLVILARGMRIAWRAGTDFERYLAAGLSGLLALQCLIIVGGTLGLMPLAGITLPFVSYGRSSLIASFFMVGMLLALSSRAPRLSASPAPPYRAASGRIVFVFVLLLGVAGMGRLVQVQALQMNAIAGGVVRTPDADGQVRPHVNPRLMALAERIPRGRLLDRSARVLAITKKLPDGREKRVYPYGATLAHQIGYVDPAVGGPVGLEARFATQLRGFENWQALVPLWRRKDLPGFEMPKGRDVVLTIDAELQKAALASLQAHLSRVRDRRTGEAKNRGAVVVLDVATGGVLAAVTSPVPAAMDPNTLTPQKMQALNANIEKDFPLINRAVSGYYPPGSTFKIVTASGLFANGKADFTKTCAHVDYNVIWTADSKTYARRRIVDDESERPHGLTNLTEAVAESCNIYFGHAGIVQGPQALREHAATFGFAKMPTREQFAAELPDIAFGQGPMLTTPLEMAGVALTVAAGGRRLAPKYAKDQAATVASNPLSPEDAARLADMMRRVTVSGTAAGRFADLPYAVAGKTGTAQNNEGDRMSHSWFIGFAPVENPKVAFAVVGENAGYGASVAVPVSRDVLRAARLER